jgi:two-component system response regulator QseB
VSSTVSSPEPERLLLVEDDLELAELLVGVFGDEGYTVDHAGDGQRGLHFGLTRSYRVMIIDRRLPVLGGVDLLRRLRSRGVTARALLLTALGSLPDRVDGLDSGADDYVVKPFEVDELTARVRALRRRHLDAAALVPVGSGFLDVPAHEAVLPQGQRVALSVREFELLRLLAAHPSTVHPRAELRRKVFADTPAASIVDTYVYYLRRKLGRAAVRTVRGLGYQLGTL